LDWGQSINLAPNVDVHLEQAYHWSARGLHDRRKALWGAFVITTPEGPIYFAGDTAYRDGKTFKEAHAKYGDFRVAMLPIGAYAPRWFMKNNHMGPDEAVQAHRDLGQPFSLAMHFQTLQLTDEAIDAPAAELAAALDSGGLKRDRFLATAIGAGYDIP
jgi:L-ascorbate metabolism protein UlaG (beta-lactamase superfamily)